MCIDNDTHSVISNANDTALNSNKILYFNGDSFGTFKTEKNIINTIIQMPLTIYTLKMMFCYITANAKIRRCLR